MAKFKLNPKMQKIYNTYKKWHKEFETKGYHMDKPFTPKEFSQYYRDAKAAKKSNVSKYLADVQKTYTYQEARSLSKILKDTHPEFKDYKKILQQEDRQAMYKLVTQEVEYDPQVFINKASNYLKDKLNLDVKGNSLEAIKTAINEMNLTSEQKKRAKSYITRMTKSLSKAREKYREAREKYEAIYR